MTAKFRAAAAILGVGVLGALLLWGFGCSRTNSELSQASSGGEAFSWLSIRPASGDTTRVLRNAHYLKMMGRPEMALKELEAAYQQNPRNLQILDNLARTYEEVGEFPRAQKIYQEALALDGSNQALHNNLCFSYYLAGQWEQAEACFRQALAKNPQNIMARNNLGLLLCRRGRGEEARRLWQEAEGALAAQKKMQQVMVALSPGEPAPYAQGPQPTTPAPVQVASLLDKPPLTSQPEAAKEMAAVPAPIPAALPAPQAREPETTAPKPAVATAQPDKLPSPQVTAGKPLAPPSSPAAPAPKAQEPEKTAAKPALATAQPGKLPAPRLTAGKPAAPQTQEQSAAAKTKSEPAAPKAVAKPAGPAATVEKSAPAVLAAPKPQSPPAPPKQTQETEKKVTPATTPPPPAKQAKIKVAAAPAPATPEKSTETMKPGIEVLNGSGVKKLAHQTRTMLAGEGYRVVSIGNHRDFGAENTIIYYRQGVETAARNLGAKLFPQSRLQIGEKFAKNADIKVILGKDLLAPMAAARAVPAAEKVAAKTGASQPEPLTAAPTPPAVPAAPQAKTLTPPQAPAPAVAAAPPAPDKTNRAFLTAAELETAAIDIRNGTRSKNLARMARAMISQEGFQVTHIGNHVDFGADKTIIYYRPDAEKVARKLGSRFFPDSQLQQAAKLPGNASIKILLGSDLLQRPDVMAKLSD